MYANLTLRQQFCFISRLHLKRLRAQISRRLNITANAGGGEEERIGANWRQKPRNLLPKQMYSMYSSPSIEHTKTKDASEELPVRETDVDVELATMKTLLYAENVDEVHGILNQCQSVKELFNVVLENGPILQKHHSVQCVLLYSWLCGNTDDDVREQHPALIEHILQVLQPHIPDMDTNELSCCYLYLRKNGVPNSNPVVRELLLRGLDIVSSTNPEQPVSLNALSRFVVGISKENAFHTLLVCQDFLPHIVNHMANCKSSDDARLLAICGIHLQPLFDADVLNIFKLHVHQLLKTGVLDSSTPRPILKLLHMLNLPSWSHRNITLVRELLHTIAPSVQQLSPHELRNLSRIFQFHLEPAIVVKPLRMGLETLLQSHLNADNLASYVSFSEPQKRSNLINMFKALVLTKKNWKEPFASQNLFVILRGLKISDLSLCNAYWTGVVDELNEGTVEEEQQHFSRHCYHYMNFNNNLGGTYRFIPLEKKLSKLAMHAIENQVAGRIPLQFTRMASFILAYGHTPFNWKKFPNIIVSKIINMAPQFTIADCFHISRGLQAAIEMRFRSHIPFTLRMQLSTIDAVLIECAERLLSAGNKLSLYDLNLLVRTLATRKSLKGAIVYTEALNKYKEITLDELNSRAIREMIFNLNLSNFLSSDALDLVFDYIEINNEAIVGDTVEKILTCAYNLGYMPKSHKALEHAASIIKRDFHYMSGLSVVQACLALCYFKAIPTDLIDEVFCVKFIQRVEDEIQKCYSKATYPERVLSQVMQLNRTVCLDFPEANVPWFQQNYIEAQLSKKHSVSSPISADVKQLLKVLLKDETYFRCNHTTPYGYQIDFVIHFDRDKKPIMDPAETAMLDRITKVAILLLKLDSYSENDVTALRGPELLKMKHLEMMGYKVLHINEHDWNSKYLKVPGARANYLKCLLQISN